MIKTVVRVPQEDIIKLGQSAAFAAVLVEWEALSWVKYLREHGTIVAVQCCADLEPFYTDTYELTWELPPERETWFYLNYSEQKEQVKRMV